MWLPLNQQLHKHTTNNNQVVFPHGNHNHTFYDSITDKERIPAHEGAATIMAVTASTTAESNTQS